MAANSVWPVIRASVTVSAPRAATVILKTRVLLTIATKKIECLRSSYMKNLLIQRISKVKFKFNNSFQ